LIVIGSLAVHRDDAAEEQAGGVGEYSRAAWRDAILSEKTDDARQKAVDLVGSAQLGEVENSRLMAACIVNLFIERRPIF
jgi:hypothetical protein